MSETLEENRLFQGGPAAESNVETALQFAVRRLMTRAPRCPQLLCFDRDRQQLSLRFKVIPTCFDE